MSSDEPDEDADFLDDDAIENSIPKKPDPEALATPEWPSAPCEPIRRPAMAMRGRT
jgi:hypothetical protein